MRIQTLRRNRAYKAVSSLSGLNKDLLALSTAMSTTLAVSYLWAYLKFIGRLDLLIPSVGNVRALLVLFAVAIACFPFMFLIIALPAILLVRSHDWLGKLLPKSRNMAATLAVMVFVTVMSETLIYLLRKRYEFRFQLWQNDWIELLAALPVLFLLSLRMHRDIAYAGGDVRTRQFWQGTTKAGLPGLLAWLIAMAVCVPASQIVREHEDASTRFVKVILLVCCLVGAGIVFIRWRESVRRRNALLKRSFFLVCFLLAAVFFLSPGIFEGTMKEVAYAIGMRDRYPGGFILESKRNASEFGPIWGACDLDDKRVLVWGRRLFLFGDVVLICPGNYTAPSTPEMRQCAMEECLAVSKEEVKSWIGPTPNFCPPVRNYRVKRSGCRNFESTKDFDFWGGGETIRASLDDPDSANPYKLD